MILYSVSTQYTSNLKRFNLDIEPLSLINCGNLATRHHYATPRRQFQKTT